MASKILIVSVLQVVLVHFVYGTADMRLRLNTTNPAFDPKFYEDLLNSTTCQQQLGYMRNVSNVLLRYKFLENGLRVPRSLTQANFVDLGNYFDCLDLSQEIEGSTIEGKYCLVNPKLTIGDLGTLASALEWDDYDPEVFTSDEFVQRYRKYKDMESRVHIRNNRQSRSNFDVPEVVALLLQPRLAVCIPKACTVQEGIEGLNLLNITALGLQFNEEFCRVKNDKPWVPVDYVAVTIFSLLGLITLLSTSYDVWHTFIAKKDPKEASLLYKSFSVYNNGKRLTTFTANPNNLDCMDGIRMLSMLWVIVGHTYVTLPPLINFLDTYTDYLVSLRSLWVTSANFAVDTFFTITGVLLVYTTAGKMSGKQLLKSLHLFYLNRLLRLFPLLASIVLLQASIFHRISDGPLWADTVAKNTDLCRTYWWTTLLYVQNYVNTETQCINHGWYLAIDMHLHIVSPLVLFWVLSNNKKQAWSGLIGGLLIILTATAVYCFINKFPGWTLAPSRGEVGILDYFADYYFNSLPRAPPFFVGMVFGYLLHIWKGHKVSMHYGIVVFLWILSVFATGSLIYITHLMKDFQNWDYPVVDDLMNTFGRSIWAMAVGWVVFACKSGMGGPINWFLSLNLWKLPSRVSFAMYLFSYQIQFIISGSATAPVYFTDGSTLYQFMSQVTITFIVAFFATLLIDSPFSILFKMLLGGGPKKPKTDESKL